MNSREEKMKQGFKGAAAPPLASDLHRISFTYTSDLHRISFTYTSDLHRISFGAYLKTT